MSEQRTDWRAFRKSTHLASADLELMQSEGKKLIFHITEVKHEKKVDVSGTKMDGFFCYFREDVKAMKINNTNLLVLAGLLKARGTVAEADIYVVENYKGLVIELYVDNNVKFMGDIVDGIRIKKTEPVTEKPVLTAEHPKFADAKKAVADGKLEAVQKRYQITPAVLKLLKAK
tara:strand:+ start:368 stop:889 length:522 start_codon:yes stop_codon:yes gene_type:complete